MQNLTGTGVALITPFKEDLSVDTAALRKLVNFQIENAVDYLVVLGTTGESATLNKSEKQQVIACVLEENNGKLPLVLGLGGNNTKQVAEDLRDINLDAFDAVLSVSPYYSRPTQEGIYQHYKVLSEVSSKPIIIYNVPSRTGSNILPSTVKRLATDFKNIIGIKEAAGDMVQAMKLIAAVPKDFLVISGDDMLALPIVLAGGHGVISVIGQGFPAEFSKMIQHGLQKEVEKAYSLHYRLAPVIDLIFEEGNPAGIKALLNKVGICENTLRLPLVKTGGKLSKEINNFVDNFAHI